MTATTRVNGITYDVVQYTTREEIATRYPNTARHLEASGIVAQVLLKRPKGHKHYMANHYGADRWLVLTRRGI